MPLTAQEFAGRMAAFAPFEPNPVIAVAVSGGRDSMALARLAQDWALGVGGRAVALTVDHGLRPGSAAEADQVSAWMSPRGIDHHVLPWHGDKPASNIQAEARAARYRLLNDWCADHGVLHLLVAHHREDQAETVALRRERGSGAAGLAGMSPIRPLWNVRLLRPLLDVSRARLTATMQSLGQDWVDDPSNQNPRFARARLRGSTLDIPGLLGLAGEMAQHRRDMDAAAAQALLDLVEFHRQGFVTLDRSGFCALEPDVAAYLLARLVTVIGGRPHPPRSERLGRVLDGLGRGLRSATLGGCRFAPLPQDRILICREFRQLEPPKMLPPGQVVMWDGRVRARVSQGTATRYSVGALGPEGWRDLVKRLPRRNMAGIPRLAGLVLPAVRTEDHICAVPFLGYKNICEGDEVWMAWSCFSPIIPSSARL